MAGVPDGMMSGAMDAMRMQLENARAFQAGQADLGSLAAAAAAAAPALPGGLPAGLPGGAAQLLGGGTQPGVSQMDPAVLAALLGGNNGSLPGIPPPGLPSLPNLGLIGGGLRPPSAPLGGVPPLPGQFPPRGPLAGLPASLLGGDVRPEGSSILPGAASLLTGAPPPGVGLPAAPRPPPGAAGKNQLRPPMETAAQTSAREAAAAAKQQKEEKEREKAALREEANKVKCHLHTKPKKGCKFCTRFQDAQAKVDEKDEAIPEGRIGLAGGSNSYEDIRNGRVPVEIVNMKTYGFSPLLQSHIVESKHFKELLNITGFDQLLQETFDYADSVEPYMGGTVGSTTPSSLFCCLYRMFTVGIDSRQLCRLIENVNSPYIRCMGFLFVRFGLPPDQLWLWLGEFVLDTEELRPTKGSAIQTTIGEYVEALLREEKYYATPLPRLPNSAKRQLEAKLAPVPQYRKRVKANLELLEVYRKRGVQVEANSGGEWLSGTTTELIDDAPSRIKVRVQLDGIGEEIVPLGKVILTDQRYNSYGGAPKAQEKGERAGRGRSRSRSPHNVDWSREKGRADQELIDEMRSKDREKAVASGKDYAKKPVGFKKACALPREQGVASYRLMEEETYVSDRQARRRGPSPEADRQQAQAKPSAEHQARMQQLFEKYGMAKSAASDSAARPGDVEADTVLRFG